MYIRKDWVCTGMGLPMRALAMTGFESTNAGMGMSQMGLCFFRFVSKDWV